MTSLPAEMALAISNELDLTSPLSVIDFNRWAINEMQNENTLEMELLRHSQSVLFQSVLTHNEMSSPAQFDSDIDDRIRCIPIGFQMQLPLLKEKCTKVQNDAILRMSTVMRCDLRLPLSDPLFQIPSSSSSSLFSAVLLDDEYLNADSDSIKGELSSLFNVADPIDECLFLTVSDKSLDRQVPPEPLALDSVMTDMKPLPVPRLSDSFGNELIDKLITKEDVSLSELGGDDAAGMNEIEQMYQDDPLFQDDKSNHRHIISLSLPQVLETVLEKQDADSLLLDTDDSKQDELVDTGATEVIMRQIMDEQVQQTDMTKGKYYVPFSHTNLEEKHRQPRESSSIHTRDHIVKVEPVRLTHIMSKNEKRADNLAQYNLSLNWNPVGADFSSVKELSHILDVGEAPDDGDELFQSDAVDAAILMHSSPPTSQDLIVLKIHERHPKNEEQVSSHNYVEKSDLKRKCDSTESVEEFMLMRGRKLKPLRSPATGNFKNTNSLPSYRFIYQPETTFPLHPTTSSNKGLMVMGSMRLSYKKQLTTHLESSLGASIYFYDPPSSNGATTMVIPDLILTPREAILFFPVLTISQVSFNGGGNGGANGEGGVEHPLAQEICDLFSGQYDKITLILLLSSTSSSTSSNSNSNSTKRNAMGLTEPVMKGYAKFLTSALQIQHKTGMEVDIRFSRDAMHASLITGQLFHSSYEKGNSGGGYVDKCLDVDRVLGSTGSTMLLNTGIINPVHLLHLIHQQQNLNQNQNQNQKDASLLETILSSKSPAELRDLFQTVNKDINESGEADVLDVLFHLTHH